MTPDGTGALRRFTPGRVARPFLAREHGVPVERAVHPGARNEEVLTLLRQDEPETLGPHGDPAGHKIRVLDRRVLLASHPRDLSPALERVETLSERVFLGFSNVERLLVIVAVLTLLYGNLAALPQNNLKRLLAYSSIAHAGYLLIGVACVDGRAVTFYLVAYLLMTLLSFAVLVVISQRTGDEIADFNGLAKRSPFLAFAMLVAMASLAGVPLTAGFFGKFLIFWAAIAQHQTTLIVVGAITVACGFYYYLKVVRAMYWESAAKIDSIPVSALSKLAMTLLIVAIIWLGIYPQPILRALVSQRAPAMVMNP